MRAVLDDAGASARPDFVMGNTRLRARLPQLLTPPQLAVLGGLDGDEAVTWLRNTPYGRHLPSGGDPRYAITLAAQARLREVLTGAVTAYAGPAREVVTALLCRYDADDLVTLVRSAARNVPPAATRPLLHAIGRLRTADLADVVAADSAARIPRLAALRELDDGTRRAVSAGAEAFGRTGDLAAWEAAVAHAVWTHADRVLERAGRPARLARQVLSGARDAANLVTALRLRTASTGEAGRGPRFLPAGLVPLAALDAVAAGGRPGMSAAPVVPQLWRPAVRRWAATGELGALSAELEALRGAEARRLLRAGDPLSVAVPIGYLAAAEHEAALVRRAGLSERKAVTA